MAMVTHKHSEMMTANLPTDSMSNRTFALNRTANGNCQTLVQNNYTNSVEQQDYQLMMDDVDRSDSVDTDTVRREDEATTTQSSALQHQHRHRSVQNKKRMAGIALIGLIVGLAILGLLTADEPTPVRQHRLTVNANLRKQQEQLLMLSMLEDQKDHDDGDDDDESVVSLDNVVDTDQVLHNSTMAAAMTRGSADLNVHRVDDKTPTITMMMIEKDMGENVEEK